MFHLRYFWLIGMSALLSTICSETRAAAEERFQFRASPPISKEALRPGCKMRISKGISSWSSKGLGLPKFYELRKDVKNSSPCICLDINKEGYPSLEFGTVTRTIKLAALSKLELQKLYGPYSEEKDHARYELLGFDGKTWNQFNIDFRFNESNTIESYRASGIGISDESWHRI